MISGSTAGTSTMRVIANASRRSARPSLISTGRTAATAPMVDSAIGGMPNIAPNATLAEMPRPNTSSTSGYSRTLGIDAKPISIGTNSSPDARLKPNQTPSEMPPPMAMASARLKAHMVSAKLIQNSSVFSKRAVACTVSTGPRSASSPATHLQSALPQSVERAPAGALLRESGLQDLISTGRRRFAHHVLIHNPIESGLWACPCLRVTRRGRASARAHRIQQRPVALLQLESLRKRRARLHAERAHDPVVAVVALQDEAAQYRGAPRRPSRAAGRRRLPPARFEIGEPPPASASSIRSTASTCPASRPRLFRMSAKIASSAALGTRVFGAGRDHHLGEAAQRAALIGQVSHARPQSNRLARRCLMVSAM